MNIWPSVFCVEGADLPIAIVKEKSSSRPDGADASSITAVVTGFGASSGSNENCDWSSLAALRLLRARYDARRCDNSLRQAASPLVAGRLDSQKLHTRTFEGSTAPHCKHVLVTGAFLRCGRMHSGEE